MRFGLKETDIEEIVSELNKFPEIERAKLFGSRAKGNYRAGSDVDIAVFGEQVSFATVAKLHSALEELSKMPYLFDIVDCTHLQDGELKDHINRVGIEIYVGHRGKD
jgi:uncharacterized protein